MLKMIYLIAISFAAMAFMAEVYGMAGSAGPQRRWTLEDCIAYALEHNIEIKRQELVRKDLQIARSSGSMLTMQVPMSQ